MRYPVDAGAALATLFGYVLSDICPTYGPLLSSPSTKRTYNQLHQPEFSMSETMAVSQRKGEESGS